MAFGTSLHAGIAHNYRQKIESRQDLPVGEVKEFFAADWEHQKGQVAWEPDENPGKMMDEGAALLEIYQSKIAPKIQPRIVEDLFELKFENTEYTFRGIIDLVDDTSGLIIDHKTSTKTPSPTNVHKDIQLTAYALGNRVRTGEIENGAAFDYLIRGRSPKVIRIETTRSDEDIQRFLKMLAQIAAAIKAELFWPAPNHPYCSPKLCPFWSECEGGRKL
ncbi:MAG: hypothetical protein A2X40_07695 [Elusimicrobia bacterium GWC2_65_9]|nr:MAG: hypothetical protein A2X37_06015 [Elusimicrobia bacterium GWA2_66_18]OGR70636.1 MAG: hypothetical protein A2X40_07695 [Elusimicrobia bacterium GWC2_65_9]